MADTLKAKPRPVKEIPMKVSVHQRGTGTWIATFKHPIAGKTVCNTLKKVRTAYDAERCKVDLEKLCNDATFHDDPPVLRLLPLHKAAVNLFYQYAIKTLPANWDDDIFRRAVDERIAETQSKMDAGEPVNWQKLVEDYSRMYSDEQRLRVKAEAEASEVPHLREEISRLRLLLNVDVKDTLLQAAAKFEHAYTVSGVAPRTAKEAVTAVNQFVQILGEQKLVGRVTTADVDQYLRDVKGEDGTPLAPVTKATRRSMVSRFWSWAKKYYGLASNPMLDADPVKGVARSMSVTAITDLTELQALLCAFDGYWKAWVHVACLAGLRFSEQVWLRTCDVDIKVGLVYVRNHKYHSVKTGRERKVPIERTTLLPLLTAYLQTHKGEWLFPMPAEIERRKRDDGKPVDVWSHNSNWRDHFDAQVNKVKTQGEFWDYGPAEWRHTFGTLLANCGHNALQISRLMGNSPAVADKFYVAEIHHSAHWPYKFA
jgi:integrase